MKRTVTVGTLADLLAEVHALLRRWGVSEADTDVWFRGVDHARHPLLPKIYRKACKGMDPDNLVYRFQTSGASLVPSRPGVWEWYFTAQHYGLPTRLLDWTDNLYTAVYFALAPFFDQTPLTKVIRKAKSSGGRVGDSANPPVIWVLDAADLNRVTAGIKSILVPGETPSERTSLWMPEHVKRGRSRSRVFRGRRVKNMKPIAILPPRTTARITAQQGVFTIHGSGALPLDVYYGRRSSHRLARIALDTSRAHGIWRDLALCGINHFSVFPDLQNLARHVYLSNA